MDQTKATIASEAKENVHGSGSTSQASDPADSSRQHPSVIKTALQDTGIQPSHPTTHHPTASQPTPTATHDVPNTAPGSAPEPVKSKAPVVDQAPNSGGNPSVAPPSKETQASADTKQKNTSGDAAKSKLVPGPGVLSDLERVDHKYLGLRALVVPETEDIDIDIVFLHGIAAHPYRTWKHKKTGVHWLEEKSMLPKALPNARIMYFGYQSAWYGQNAVRQTVNTAADQLLNSLVSGQLRENCPDRPIIFIAHCFGGLIVQRAFHVAHAQRSNFPGLIDAITGLIFLGTPHSGVDGNSALSTQGDIYQAIVQAKVKTHFETIESMTHNNQILHGIVQDFNTILRNEVVVKPEIYSFYEMHTSPVGKLGGLGNISQEFVVTESSATIPGHGSTGLYANHFNMNTFEDDQDANYEAVRQQIAKMAKLSRQNQEKRTKDTKSQSRNNPALFAKLPIPIKKDGVFAERGDILTLLEKKFNDDGALLVALTGGLGNGKTHIAVEYAYRYCIDNPGAYIHWIDASSAEQFEFSYKRIAEALQIHLRDPNSPQEIVRDVCYALKKGANSHWLMVVDGIDNESSLHWTGSDTHDEPTIWDFVPKGRHSSVLVTTRDERLARRFVEQKHQFIVEVNRLRDKDAAFILFGKHTSGKDKFDRAVRLAKRLGATAGALTFIHAYRTKVDRKIDLKAYEEKLKLPDWSKSDPSANAVLAWGSLYKGLETKYPDAATLLCSLGVLNVQIIPKDFFQKTDWKLTRTLEEYDMIERSADDRVIRVTGIVRLCLQRYLEEWGKKESVEGKVLDQLCETLKGGDHELDEALLPSILAALKFETKSTDSKKSAVFLHLKVAQYYQHIGRFQAAIPHFEKCLTPRPKDSKRPYFLLDKDAESARQALDRAKIDLNSSKSSSLTSAKPFNTPISPRVPIPNPREVHTELQHLEKTSGPRHLSTIQKVAELAALRLAHPSMRHAYKDRSNKLAGTCGLPAPASHSPRIPSVHSSPDPSPQLRSSEGFKPPIVGTLGKNDRSASTRLPTAEQPQPGLQNDEATEDGTAALYQRLLTSAVDTYGENNMCTANAHYSLALAHEAEDNFPQSQSHFFKALAIARTHIGVESPEYLRMMRALACLYARQGNEYLQQAQRIFTFVLQKQTQVLGETHPETLITRHNVALFLEEAGEWEAAGQELERILVLQGYWLGRDAQETLQTACSLAMNYAARKKRKEAEELFRATLATQEQVLGATHVDTVTTAERMREFLENAHQDEGKRG